MSKRRSAVIGSVASAAMVGCLTSGALLLLSHRLVQELSRPGVIIDETSPFWADWRFPAGDPEPPDQLRRRLDFTATDGTRLRGEFWAQPQPAPTIIISHGFRMPSALFRPVAALEYRHGSNIMLFDYRGHGESDAIYTSGGNAEIQDLAAAIALAALQPETRDGKVFIHGFSMGAAIALLTPPRPEVAGIIADSPYARLDEMLQHIVQWQMQTLTASWPPALAPIRRLIPALTQVALLGSRGLFRLRYHQTLNASPEQAVRDAAQQAQHPLPPLLLIHATGDPLIQFDQAQRVVAAARAGGWRVTEYFVPSAVHCGAYGADPDAYNNHLLEFVHGSSATV